MAFDVKQFSLVIFEYQYLGGAGSEMIGGIRLYSAKSMIKRLENKEEEVE
jgi:hypothetical protein